MPFNDILLAAVNARYSHTSFGLRWLWANLGELQSRASILEFDLKRAERLLPALQANPPRILGLGVYIWNVSLLTEIVSSIRQTLPETLVVLGGPEISHEYEDTRLFADAHYLVRGEGEIAFARLARALLAGEQPEQKVIDAPPPNLAELTLPYAAYTDEDIAHRMLYVETSRGCPFQCEFCLSSIERSVRYFPLGPFLAAMEQLIERGARHFKFVDRTFNVHRERMDAVLDFFQARWRDGMQLHFEIVPDRLDRHTLERIQAMPPEGLHLEAGVQTFHPGAQAAISRCQDLEKTEANLRFLREETGALLHADLIAGLPGESWESWRDGFNRLWALRPHVIQAGILKRLRGTPIARHTATHRMRYASEPPYEILENDCLSCEQLEHLKRFARYLDLFANAGHFPGTLPRLWEAGPTPFDAFMDFSDFVWTATSKTHQIALAERVTLLYRFLVMRHAGQPEEIEAALRRDFCSKPGRSDRLVFDVPDS